MSGSGYLEFYNTRNLIFKTSNTQQTVDYDTLLTPDLKILF